MSEKSLFCGINKVNDFNNMTEFEKKHTPIIKSPDTVKIGEPFEVNIKIPHVMEEGHHIQWINIFSEENFNVRVEFTPVFTKPEISVKLIKNNCKNGKSTLRVIERCNLHGEWESTKEIIVKE